MLCAAIPALALSACVPPPDSASGGDAERYTAKPLAVGKWEPDAVDGSGGDKTDWKVMDLQDTGFLTVELALDNPDAEVTISLFDRYGKPVARTGHRKGDDPHVKLTTDVGLGKYFVRIQADHDNDKTGYSIRALVR